MKPIATFKDPPGGVYNADCRDVLGKFAGKVDMIFADPPFNVGEDYGTVDDSLPEYDYQLMLRKSLHMCCHALRDGGTIWVNCPDPVVMQAIRALDQGHCQVRRWCIWHYRFGQCTKGNFISSHTHVIYAIKDRSWHSNKTFTAPYTWNPEAILVPSDRATKYNDPRTKGKKDGHDGLRVPLDVWTDVPRVTGNSKERIPQRPNQIPERLVERCIRATTNAGDLVLDPFGGTGTTLVVARALGRKAVTIELDHAAAKDIVRRAKKGAVNVG